MKSKEILIETSSSNIDAASSKVQACANEGLSSDAISRINQLEAKFDIWQGMVEPMLASSQTAVQAAQITMEYDSNAFTYIGVAIAIVSIATAVAGIWFAYWLSKSRKQAVDDASKELTNKYEKIADDVSKGILKEGTALRTRLLNAILDSEEFKEAVRATQDYEDSQDDAEDAIMTTRIETISAKNLESKPNSDEK